MTKAHWIAAAAVVIVYSAPVLGDPAPQRKPLDPNQRVCEDITATGSRLATKRICATRAEWAQRHREEQSLVDQIQRSPNVGCDVVDQHSGTPRCN